MNNVNQLSVRSGVVEDLTRTTHVTSSGGEHPTSNTTHIAMIKLAGKHTEYRSASPIPISEGEDIKVVGIEERGLLKIIALKNFSTGWMTPLSTSNSVMSGCGIAWVIFMLIPLTIGLVLALIFEPGLALIPFGFIAVILGVSYSNVSSSKKRLELSRQAHALLMSSPTPPPLPRNSPPPLPPR